ncbi:MAG: hypothetical protein ACXW3O_09150 [Brevundimonas sp.]
MLTIVLGAVMIKAVADMMAAYTGQARAIDRAVNEGQARPPT